MILYCNVVLPTWQHVLPALILCVPHTSTAMYCLHDAQKQYSSNDRKTVRAKLNYGSKVLMSGLTILLVIGFTYGAFVVEPKKA